MVDTLTHIPVRSPAREERMPEPRYKSTLDMPYDLFVRFKRITQERGETMRDVILKAIEEYVAKHDAAQDKGK
jgi:macrodomain Ter protein organizer (MatP/YcbG family)